MRDARGTWGHTGNSPNNASETRKGTVLSHSADGDTLPQRLGQSREMCESPSVVEGDEMEGRHCQQASLKASKSIEGRRKDEKNRWKASSKALRRVSESAGKGRGKRREGRFEAPLAGRRYVASAHDAALWNFISATLPSPAEPTHHIYPLAGRKSIASTL